jgi:tRNA-(ms[2]io[6]A)-hydroxylase
MLELKIATPPAWLEVVMADFDAFLVDHAACERKASATGLWFVARYSDRAALLDPLIGFAREELEHFQRVYRVLAARGLRLGPDAKDEYVGRMLAHGRHHKGAHLLDRLLIAGIIEARGCERFGMVANALPAGELKELYLDLTRAEARHHGLFVELARREFDEEVLRKRLDELLNAEAAIVPSLPLRAAVH